MDLERELRALDVEWPATPRLRLELARRRRRWPLAVAIALAAIAAAFAVPQSRGAILRFFDVGADRIQLVDTLPPAQERSLDAGLGDAVSATYARAFVSQLLFPPLDRQPTLYRSGDVISLVFSYAGSPVLLSELRGPSFFFKKLIGGQTHPVFVNVRNRGSGLWLEGKPHIFIFPREPARLAGNTLVWEENATTYRLEGPGLTRQKALDLARSLRDTP
jgi:hypothetical protein